MIEVLSCLANEHNYYFVALAVLVCAIGSTVTMRLYSRTRFSEGAKKFHWIFISGVTGGCTIWTTHFVAMIGFNPPLYHGYEPILTAASLFLSVVVCMFGFALSSWTRKSVLIEIGGAVVGLGIISMHYLGMKAYLIAGTINWDPTLVAWSVILGMGFGALAFNRVARPVTRYCKYFGPVTLSLAIATMHFTAMGAMQIVPDPTIFVPQSSFSDITLAFGVVGLMALVLGSGFSINMLDNKTKAENEEYFHHLSHHDSLTGLPSYDFLLQSQSSKLVLAEENGLKLALLMVELDGLWEIRNVHGQAVSDSVLKTMASRLATITGEGYYLAKGRGDSLLIAMTKVSNKKQVMEFVSRMEEEFKRPYFANDREFTVDFRCGVALHPMSNHTPQDLLVQAELALGRAEQAKTRKIVFYDPSIDENNRSRSILSMDLRYAIERNELDLFYQPQIDVPTGNLIGFEVLIRWHHPERGMVPPDQFIPIAEETGLIVPIGEWVLRTACEAASQWKRPYKIAVNVATAQLASNELPITILDILGRTGLDAKRLELEITETSIIDDHHHTLNIVRQLKQLGISIAMDDFGTGYSSLSMLQTFPFDKIKIDRSFISGVSANEQSSAIARATIVLAHGLKMKALAEGVEDDEDLAFLRQYGCQEAQGYFFGKPVPHAEIEHIVNADFVPEEEASVNVFQLSTASG
ncbi:EAL domain-containing protein [Sneathiella limimaris]|uniref:bifunctional diguanylate cyclase/phosphodiesterase n=1 Tax=Sneathiella limimaris TaxID=1964213 RepID=UPI00146C7043|nr:EAL domain-containing protein [Sneathiella limimaris]